VLANIAAAGVDPAVLLTHMHPVPSAGLSDPATGRRYFSNAELVVHENEPAHWFDDDAMAKASERQRRLYSVQRPHAAGSEGRGVSRRHRYPVPRPHAGPHLVPHQFRQRATADLGRHGARAGDTDRT
jgi:hypothetical protein